MSLDHLPTLCMLVIPILTPLFKIRRSFDLLVHIGIPMFVCLTNNTTYLTGNEGQNFRAVLSEKLEWFQHCTANA